MKRTLFVPLSGLTLGIASIFLLLLVFLPLSQAHADNGIRKGVPPEASYCYPHGTGESGAYYCYNDQSKCATAFDSETGSFNFSPSQRTCLPRVVLEGKEVSKGHSYVYGPLPETPPSQEPGNGGGEWVQKTGEPSPDSYCFQHSQNVFYCYDQLHFCKTSKTVNDMEGDKYGCRQKKDITFKKSWLYGNQRAEWGPKPPSEVGAGLAGSEYCYVVYRKYLTGPVMHKQPYRATCYVGESACNAGRSVADPDIVGGFEIGDCEPRSDIPGNISVRQWCYVVQNGNTANIAGCSETPYECGQISLKDHSKKLQAGLCMVKSRAQEKAQNYHTPTTVGGNGTSTYTHGKPQGTLWANSCTPLVQCTANCGFAQIMHMIKCIIQFLLIDIASPLVVLVLLFAGFTYLTAMGDPNKAKRARTAVIWAISGFALALIAWLLVNALIIGLGVKSGFNMLS